MDVVSGWVDTLVPKIVNTVKICGNGMAVGE